MNILILCEEKRYESLATKISCNPNVTCEISNIDFNITNSINRAQVILFLGDEAVYRSLCEQYSSLLVTKLVITFADAPLLNSDFEIIAKLSSGVCVCKVSNINDELDLVVANSLKQIFGNSFKMLTVNGEDFSVIVNEISNIEAKLEALESNPYVSAATIRKIFHNFKQ